MKVFLTPLEEMPDVARLLEKSRKERKLYEIAGVIDALKPHLIYGMGHDRKVKLVVTYDELRAKSLAEHCRFFEENVLYYPARDLLFYQSDIHGNAMTRERLAVVRALLEGQPLTVVTTIGALMNKAPSLDSYKNGIFRIAAGDTLRLSFLRERLTTLGYETVTMVEHPGEMAVRGGIVDLFPLTEEDPVRIEFWGDEVDSLRAFDRATQKSLENLESITVYPAMELVLTEDEVRAGLKAMESEAEDLYQKYRKEGKTEEAYRIRSTVSRVAEESREWGIGSELETYLEYFMEEGDSILSYFPDEAMVFLDEPLRLKQHGQAVEQEFAESMLRRLEKGYCLPRQVHMLFSTEQVFARLQKKNGMMFCALDGQSGPLKAADGITMRAVSSGAYNNRFDLLLKDLKDYRRKKYRILLLTPGRTRGKHLAEILQDQDLPCFYTEDYDHGIHRGEIMVAPGDLARGYAFPEAEFVILSDQDMFGKKKKRRRTVRYEGERIASFTDLEVGDYVVHENHGLGIYQGFEKIQVDKVIKDYIKIAYAKGDHLYIPVTQLDAIQKYSGAEGKKPKLNTLGTQEWTHTKERVRSAVGVVAKELVDLYALRQQDKGYVYGPDTVWQREFEETFPYEETEGQLQAIEDVKKDMMSPKIMDRLICGDVGYGKTEIAIRAAFKAVQEGKQVVYLVPTTILANQHYHTFLQRMSRYPVKIGLLCRFVGPAQQKETIAGLKSGATDIVIGTHRLLSQDVAYKDLGLLIIDEEQRFGVSHKEKIKQLKKNVDVLSLSATPIPRTLHMSLIGIRDMSVLEEAPLERQPIQTFVFAYNEEMIREAIVRELARGGQVYYVYNRVNRIADVAATIEQLVPEARVAYAHGKMAESKLEQIMYRFVDREIDVLVSTTIIEIGMDISNVNTIMIMDADQLGLSQLYQLRGRVGRSSRTAYAFLMYRQDKMLKEVAEKRLAAIKEFTDLGSGFKIAMRDLEIRGAGNMLGREQHGHMEAVGYDLYCKMLNEAVKREKGEIVEESFETAVDLDMDAYLPEDYIAGELQRLDLYKRISEIGSGEQKDEIMDEMIDRFGEPPKAVMNLLYLALLRMEAHKAYIVDISQKPEEIVLTMFERASIDVTAIPEFLSRHAPYLKFTADSRRPAFRLAYRMNTRVRSRDIPEMLMALVKEMQQLRQDLLPER